MIARAKPTDVVRKRYTGYCEQHDSLIDVLSVREMLEYTAELKCSQYLSHNTKVQRVDELLTEMGLAHIASSQVAVISGGERKRTSVGVELVTKPSLIFLVSWKTNYPVCGIPSYLSLICLHPRIHFERMNPLLVLIRSLRLKLLIFYTKWQMQEVVSSSPSTNLHLKFSILLTI